MVPLSRTASPPLLKLPACITSCDAQFCHKESSCFLSVVTGPPLNMFLNKGITDLKLILT